MIKNGVCLFKHATSFCLHSLANWFSFSLLSSSSSHFPHFSCKYSLYFATSSCYCIVVPCQSLLRNKFLLLHCHTLLVLERIQVGVVSYQKLFQKTLLFQVMMNVFINLFRLPRQYLFAYLIKILKILSILYTLQHVIRMLRTRFLQNGMNCIQHWIFSSATAINRIIRFEYDQRNAKQILFANKVCFMTYQSDVIECHPFIIFVCVGTFPLALHHGPSVRAVQVTQLF